MKIKLVSVLLVVFALATAAVAQSQNQSLGDYARALKKAKPESSNQTPKVFDNDNMPADGSVSVVGKPAPADSEDSKDKDQSANSSAGNKSADGKQSDAKSDKKDEPQLKPGQPMEERDAALGALKKRLDEQKQKVDLLSRELDILTKEHNLKVATFYGDPHHVADPNSLYEEQTKYKQELDEKQKALDEAKAQLSDMQDDARRHGAPDSMLE